ncbi:glycosyl hydrolase family 8 [Echinimonas agarilytica]|uniref:cellulase n=1 Tax=Echinimonas agarilytica TaxID=1215918 RepID=A0AA42B9G5_9GAMM|nr:glycosyl hydrolase family 8 [Echinimonas agarilytica]MCM2681398.1 glycosyl hydrolase family 8 [Echinimonas agarilytica]
MKYKSIYSMSGLALALSTPMAAMAATSDFQWPYNQPTNVQFNLADVESSYQVWKAARITATNAGGNGRYRVMGGVNDSSSVSEGIAYGMILTSIFDDQTEFDGLWSFAKDHFDDQNLMHWYIGAPQQYLGTGAATDGDVDMAIALVNACVKYQQGAWTQSALNIDYCADAQDIINNIYDYEVDLPGQVPFSGLDDNLGNELMPGDQWLLQPNYPDGIVNLSYFPPGFFTVFGKFTGQSNKWEAVNQRNYDLVNLVQSKPDNCSGLVPNWNKYNGDVQVVPWQTRNSGWWSYDAARFGWRIAVDAKWYGSDNAIETVNELGSFFATIGVDRIAGEYTMSGARAGDPAWTFFMANAVAPIAAATALSSVDCGEASGSVKSDAQDAYNKLLSVGDGSDYYGSYWRIVSLLLMSGNFPNLYEMANDGSPSVVITSPADGMRLDSGNGIEFIASADDDQGIAAVEFFVNEASAGADTSAPYGVIVDLNDGLSVFTALATDIDGNQSQSSSITVKVGNTAPIAVAELVSVNGLTVNVSGVNSSDADGDDLAYAWNFDGRQDIYDATASFTFADAGEYNISLQVNDGLATSVADVLTVTVEEPLSQNCEYVVMNEWASGFVAEIRITNPSATTVNDWQVAWSYADGSTVSSSWNTVLTGSGPYNASGLSWNANIQPGQTMSFGVQGQKSMLNKPAEIVLVSGAVCQ